MVNLLVGYYPRIVCRFEGVGRDRSETCPYGGGVPGAARARQRRVGVAAGMGVRVGGAGAQLARKMIRRVNTGKAATFSCHQSMPVSIA